MDTITIDGMDEHDFRHGIEDMLRADEAGQAIDKLRGLLEPYAGFDKILPPRFLDVTPADVEFGGWSKLANRLPHHDRPGFTITAIGVVLADSRALGGPGPENGRLAPFVKTFYFSDDAYPFTNATRDDLLDGYTREGFGWQGDYQATDATLSIRGIDELYGAIVELEDRLMDSKSLDAEAIRAGTIGACFLAALIHQALRDTIRKSGLPRPLCVLAACDGVYPFFDAPVVGQDESTVVATEEGIEADESETLPEDAETDPIELPSPEASLLDVAPRQHSKAMALMLDDQGNQDAARYAEMAAAKRMEAGAQRELIGVLSGTAHDPAAVFEPEPMPLDDGDLALWDEDDDEAEPAEVEQGHAEDELAEFPLDLPDPLNQAPAETEPVIEVASSNSFRARLRPPVVQADEAARDWKGHLPDWIKRLLVRLSI
jgi:hypothetical protein